MCWRKSVAEGQQDKRLRGRGKDKKRLWCHLHQLLRPLGALQLLCRGQGLWRQVSEDQLFSGKKSFFFPILSQALICIYAKKLGKIFENIFFDLQIVKREKTFFLQRGSYAILELAIAGSS